jgi:hypothetical protein
MFLIFNLCLRNSQSPGQLIKQTGQFRALVMVNLIFFLEPNIEEEKMGGKYCNAMEPLWDIVQSVFSVSGFKQWCSVECNEI